MEYSDYCRLRDDGVSEIMDKVSCKKPKFFYDFIYALVQHLDVPEIRRVSYSDILIIIDILLVRTTF